METIFFVMIALSVVTLLGHGIWVFLAFIFRSLIGDEKPRRGGPPSEMEDLAASRRQIDRLLTRGDLDEKSHSSLKRLLTTRHRQLQGLEPAPQRPAAARPAVAAPPSPIASAATPSDDVVVAEIIYEGDVRSEQPATPSPAIPPRVRKPAEVEKDRPKPIAPEVTRPAARAPESRPRPAPKTTPAAAPADTTPGEEKQRPAATPKTPQTVPSQQPAAHPTPRPRPAPRPPRRTLAEMLAAFMEEKNIRWGELVGGLLIVGCSIALVVSLRKQLEQIPYFRFFIFSGVTTSLFGVGLYTAHRWKLEATSRALLIISTLLVPLNLLAMAWLSGEGSTVYTTATGAGAIALFGVLVGLSARVIIPDAMWATVVGVVGNAGLLLAISRIVGPEASAQFVLGLGCLPVTCLVVALGSYLLQLAPHKTLEEGQVKQLFTLLGVVVFATLSAMVVLVLRTDRPTAVLDPIAPLVTLIAIPVVASGFVASRRLADTSPAAGLRTAGTVVSLSGLFAMLAAVALAWPHPGRLVLVAMLNYVAMTAAGFRYRLPGIHGLALACLSAAFLTGFHWLWGNVTTTDPALLGHEMLRALLSVQSGTASVVLFLVLAVASELIGRRWRDHGIWYAAGAGVVAMFSLALVTFDGMVDSSDDVLIRSMIVYAVYGLGALAVNVRWRNPLLTYAGLALTTGAWGWALAWHTDDFSAIWGAALAAEALLLGLAAASLRRPAGDTASTSDAVNKSTLWESFGFPLTVASETISWLAIGAALAAGWTSTQMTPWSPWHVVTSACLTVNFLALLAADRRAHRAGAAGWLLVGTVVATAGWRATIAEFADVPLLISFCLAATSVPMAVTATLVARRGARRTGSGETESIDRLWYAPLAQDWLHVALACVFLMGSLWAFSTTWADSSLPYMAAWLAAATCFLGAWGYGAPPFSWAASALVLGGLVHMLVWRHPGWFPHPWPLALVVHATLTLLAGSCLARWFGLERHEESDSTPGTAPGLARFLQSILTPLIDSGVASSLAAVPLIVMLTRSWEQVLPTAWTLFWLAGIWLVAAWLHRWRSLFAAGQVMLTAGVLLATTGWLETQSWFAGDLQRLLDPWSLHCYGLGLALLSLVWIVARIVLRRNAKAAYLFLDQPWAVDRTVLLSTVFGQLALAAWCVLPSAGLELDLWPRQYSEAALRLQDHACGMSAWALVVALAVPLTTALWHRWRNGEMLAAASLWITAAIMLAGPFGPHLATASALRWSLSLAFLTLSVATWFRLPLRDLAARLQAKFAPDDQSLAWMAALTLILTAQPALLITLVAIVQEVLGMPAVGPAGSVFLLFPLSVSYLVPLCLIVIGFVGSAVRERSPEYAVTGGVIATAGVVGAYMLTAPTIEFVRCIQLFIISTAVWTILWLAVRRRLSMWLESGDDARGRALMGLQLAMPTVGNVFLLLTAFFLLGTFVALTPGIRGIATFVRETGSPFGWASLLLTVGAWAYRSGQLRRPLRPEVIGLVGMSVMGLLACSVTNWGETWGYITLMMGWSMYALAVVSATWYVASQRPDDEAPQALLRAAATWVVVPAILAVLLGIQGAWIHDLPLWSAAAIAISSASGAAMAVWRRREGWAFASGLGVNLAASLVVFDVFPALGEERWINLLQANLIASAAVALVWLGARRRLYRGQELSLRSGPLLSLQVTVALSVQMLLMCVPMWFVLMEPARGVQEFSLLARPAGWLAWGLVLAATYWYFWQVARQNVVHVTALVAVTLPLMLACVFTRPWSAFHMLLIAWGLAGFIMTAAGLVSQRYLSSNTPDTPVPLHLQPWMAFQPVGAIQSWTTVLVLLIVGFALRGGWIDPHGPAWTGSALIVAAVLWAIHAVWRTSPGLTFASGLLLCGTSSLIWWHHFEHDAADFVYSNVLALSAGSILWGLGAMASQRVRSTLQAGHGLLCYPQFAATLGLSLLVAGVVSAISGDLRWTPASTANMTLAWSALAAITLAMLFCLRLPPRSLARGGAFVLGLATVSLLIHQQQPAPVEVAWLFGWGLAAYVFAASLLDRLAILSPPVRAWLDLEAESVSETADWFSVALALVSAVAIPLSVWTSFHFDDFSQRFAGPLALTLIMVMGGVRSTRCRESLRGAWLCAVLGTGSLVLAAYGWACWPAAATYLLEGSVVLMTALGAMAALCAWLSGTQWDRGRPWNDASRTMLPLFGGLWASMLVMILVNEALYSPQARVEIALPAVLLVAATLITVMVGCLILALSPRRDPFGFSDRGRQAYVYSVEVLIAVLCAHFWFTRPEWFQMHVFREYWLFWMMAIAFGGAALAQLFERRRLPVLAEPLARTAQGLPLLPAIGFWLPIATESSTLVWFLIASFYAFQAYTRRSVAWAVVAGLCANVGLWVTWHQWDISFFDNPQIWLIPPALAVLIAEYLNHDRLKSEQSVTIRYLALSIVYVSSTADMFIAGVGNSLVLPLVLAFLAVAGVLLGIMLRVRAFLLLGVTFLTVVIMTMIWHAAVDLRHTWVWFVFGIVLGVAIIALFAVFEKRRNDVLAAIDQMRSWD